MRSTASICFKAILAAFAISLSVNTALADDYRVEVGAATEAGKDAGVLSCAFDKMCAARLDALKLRVRVYVPRREPGQATVYLDREDLGCCYFAGGGRSTTVAPEMRVSRLPLFTGAGARGGLFVENERIGTLYLRFRFLRDKN